MHAVLETVVTRISDALRSLDAETAQLHPGGFAYKWSAQQVVEHLVLGYRLTSAALETRLQKGRAPRNQQRTPLQWLLQIMILSFGSIPSGAPALEETTPVAGQFAPMNGRQLADCLRGEVERLDSLLDQSRRKFGMERVANHPWLGSLRVDQWRRFHAIHGVHHLLQIQSVIAAVAPAPLPTSAVGPMLVEKLQVPAQSPIA
jgi:hypothetical protein